MHVTTEDDRLLSAWHSQRDPEAFRRLCERYVGVIEGVCRRQRSPDAPEAVQAVFLVLARRAGAVRCDSLGAWLVATAHRVVLNQQRSVARRRRHEQEAAVQQASQHADSEPVWVEAREHLDEALASLSAGRREAILRFYLAGRPQTEVATELGCSVAAVKMRVHEGLEGLRVFFARKGIACGAGVLASGLASEATASDPTLVASCVQTVLTPAAAPAAVTLANGVFTTMFIKTATLVAAGLVLAGSCLTAALVVGAEPTPTSVAGSTPRIIPETPRENLVVISPHGGDASAAFAQLERQGGPQVLLFGEKKHWLFVPADLSLFVPAELRFQAVEGRKLVEAVAATRALRTAWVRDGTAAVLYEGVADGDVERVRKELASADAVVRREAAWRAGWLGDVRVVPLLIKAAKDADAEVAGRALVGLRRLSWAVVVLLNETAVAMLTTELDSWDATVRRGATQALGRVGGEKALELLEKALVDQDDSVRGAAAEALGRVGGDTALALLEKALQESIVRNKADSRWLDSSEGGIVVSAIGRIGGDKALAVLEKALADQDQSLRWAVARALGNVGGEKALVLLEKVLADHDAGVRAYAVSALGDVGGDKALALLEKALADQDPDVRRNATEAIGCVGGNKALRLLEKALADQDDNVRCVAATALGCVGGDTALALLEKALADQDDRVRREAAEAMGNVGGERALALLEKALSAQDANVRPLAVRALGNVGGEKTFQLLDKALVDQDTNVRGSAVSALGGVGGKKALALLEKALADQDAKVRMHAAGELRYMSGEKEVALLEKALAVLEKAFVDQDGNVRNSAVCSLITVAGERELALLEKALADSDISVSYAAIVMLRNVGGDKAQSLLEKALANSVSLVVRMEAADALVHAQVSAGGERELALLEKFLADQDANMRRGAVQVLGRARWDKKLALLEKALADQDVDVRRDATEALGRMGGEKARDLLLGRLAGEKDREVLERVSQMLKWRFANDPAAVNAMKFFILPDEPEPQSASNF